MIFCGVITSQFTSLANCFIETCSQVTLKGSTNAVAIAEAGFYSQLHGHQGDPEGVFRWIRHNTIAHINTLQPFFNSLNGALAACYLVKLSPLLVRKINPLVARHGGSEWISIALALGAIGGTVWVLMRLSPHLSPTKIKEEKAPYQIVEKHSYSQRWANRLLIVKMVAQGVFAALEQNYAALLLTLAETGYSLWKNWEVRWLFISKSTDGNSHARSSSRTGFSYSLTLYKAYKATFRTLLLPFHNKYSEPGQFYCTQHWSSRKSLITAAKQKLDAITSELKFSYEPFRHFDKTIIFSANVGYGNFPICSMCVEAPRQHCLSFRMHDQLFFAKINRILDGQPLFERLYAAYNSAEAGLAYLRHIPEWGETVYKIQTLLLISDLIGLCKTYYLEKRMKEKEYRPLTRVLMSVAIGAFAFYSHYLILMLNQGAKPIDQLDPPFPEYLMQWIGLNRLVQTGLLLFFSKSLNANLLSFSAQLYSFNQIYSLKGG